MICKPCREVVHEKCDGVLRHPSYCDCQHRGFIMAVERIDKAMLAASYAVESIVQNRMWETSPGMPEPESVGEGQ